MFFLVRVAFWLSIVIVLLPTGQTQTPSQGPQVGAVDALAAAGAAVSDMRQFCARQPEACEVGSQAAAAFGQKAQASAKMLFEFLSERWNAEQPAGDAARTAPENKAAPAKPSSGTAPRRAPETTGSLAGPASRDTLTPADRAPAWRGPSPHLSQKSGQTS